MPTWYTSKIEKLNKKNLAKAQKIAWLANKEKRENFLQEIDEKNKGILNLLNNKQISKIALAMLCLGEGSKIMRGSVMFGNSDPVIVKLFMKLLRHCYIIDEKKIKRDSPV